LRPRLLVTAGPLRDSTIPLPEGESTLGRDPTNAVAVVDPSVSRKHCLLRQGEDGRFQVKDLDSRNGTLVNGLAVKEQWLHHGDEIATGDSVFLFLLEDAEQALASRVEFDDGQPAAETKLIYPKEVIYLQPDRLLKELPATSPLARNLSALLKISRVVHAIRDRKTIPGDWPPRNCLVEYKSEPDEFEFGLPDSGIESGIPAVFCRHSELASWGRSTGFRVTRRRFGGARLGEWCKSRNAIMTVEHLHKP